ISPIHGNLQVTEYSFPGPPSLVGKKIVMISDLHYGFYFFEREARIVLDKVASLKPDIVMLPGDLTDKPTNDLSDFFFLYGDPPWKTYFSPGNHDKDSVSDFRVQEQVASLGWTSLCNDKVEFDDYVIVGMDSAMMGPVAPDLLHLAGHTHGGQILAFGQPIMLPTYGKIYTKGYYKRANNNHLIVGRGLGCKFVNVRVGAPPEIVSITFT
ncbi:MAG TPA: metallophosphoesterase, partial [Candidatus Methylacidiphilales bacterium]